MLTRRGDRDLITRTHIGQESSQRRAIISYFERLGFAEFESGLNRFGEVLKAAARLRNDSNYEALLIAHEYEHARMSFAFTRLAEALCAAADVTAHFLRDAFSVFVAHDPDLESNREAFQAFLYDYLHRRILNAVAQKLEGYPRLIAQLGEFVAACSR